MAVPVTPRGQSPGPQKHSAFPGVSRIHQENNRISSRHASAVETGIVAIDASVASTMEIREISVIARHGAYFLQTGGRRQLFASMQRFPTFVSCETSYCRRTPGQALAKSWLCPASIPWISVVQVAIGSSRSGERGKGSYAGRSIGVGNQSRPCHDRCAQGTARAHPRIHMASSLGAAAADSLVSGANHVTIRST